MSVKDMVAELPLQHKHVHEVRRDVAVVVSSDPHIRRRGIDWVRSQPN